MLPKRRKKIRPLKSQVPPNESLARIQASTSSKNAARKLAVPAETDWAMVWQVFLAAIIASVCTILELFLWATYRNVPELTQEYLNQFLPWLHHYVIGHELDRELYLLGLLLFPTQLVIFVGCLRWANVRLKHGQEYLVTWMPGIMLGIIVWFLWLNSLVKWQYLLPRNVPFTQAVAWRCAWTVFLSLLFAVGLLIYRKLNLNGRRRCEQATWIVLPLTLVLIFFFQWFDEYKLFSIIYPHHFNSIFDANVQLYLGRPLLCRGLTHQYGLYPYFLEPLFRIIGLSVVSFSFVMQSLQVAVFGMIFWGLRRYSQHIGWAIATGLSLSTSSTFKILFTGKLLIFSTNTTR
jgi:hypothetical protein